MNLIQIEFFAESENSKLRKLQTLTFNFVNNEIVLTVVSSQPEFGRQFEENPCLQLFTVSFPLSLTRQLTILGFCYCKKQIDFVFS